MRLFERCLAQGWPEWPQWPAGTRDRVRRSVVTFINGITASAVVSRGDWPPVKQIEQLRLQLELLHEWGTQTAASKPARAQRAARSGDSAA
jgi:hypothetical protein